MIRHASITCLALALTTIPLPGRPALAAGPLPPFHGAIDFEKSVPDLTPEALKGKGALIVFFQSWCPICNQWSADLLRQIEAAHGSNPGLMLIAIKTDDGGVKGAESYLKEKGANVDLWFIGSDPRAEYYKKVTGKNELWNYALVNAEGNIAEIGQAGAFWSDGPEKGKFTLSSKDVVKKCGKIQTLLPADGKYPGELARIARVAELGALGQAMKACTAAAAKSKHKEAAGQLLAALQTAAKARLQELMKTAGDDKADSGRRYEAHKELAGLVKELAGQPLATEAATLVNKVSQDPAMRKEKAAEDEYRPIAAKMDKASAKGKPAVAKELKRIGEKYPGTLYGTRATEEAEEAAQPAPPDKGRR